MARGLPSGAPPSPWIPVVTGMTVKEVDRLWLRVVFMRIRVAGVEGCGEGGDVREDIRTYGQNVPPPYRLCEEPRITVLSVQPLSPRARASTHGWWTP